MVKPVAPILRHIAIFSGNTILGDGSVIMILDPNGIATALGASGAASHEIADENAASRASAADQLTSLLVFRAGTSQPKAVPLGLVTRLEEIADRQDRALQRPLHGAIPRPADAAGADGRRQCPDLGLAADPGVRRRPPLDGARGRRDHRHRRGEAQHRGRRQRGRHSRLRRDQGPGHRGDRRRPLPADGVPRLVHAARRWRHRRRRNRCCWSTTARSSATCWRRC